MGNQLNVRIPMISQDQMIDIATITGMTQTQIIIMAIDHLYKEARIAFEKKGKEEEKALQKYSLTDLLEGNLDRKDLTDDQVKLPGLEGVLRVINE